MSDEFLEKLAVVMTVTCVRNTVIEQYHAEGKLSDADMKAFNKEVADRICTFLEFLLTRPKDEQQKFLDQMAFLASGELKSWDKPGSVIGMWPCETDASKYDPRFTPTQGLYLSFIHQYTVLNGSPPAETDLQAYFRTSAPAIHDDVLTLESRGLIERTPGQARSIRVLVPPAELPKLPFPIPTDGTAPARR